MESDDQSSLSDSPATAGFGHIDFDNPIVSNVPHGRHNIEEEHVPDEGTSADNYEYEVENLKHDKAGNDENETDKDVRADQENSSNASTTEDGSSVSEDFEERTIECVCPKVNCKEKIILCLDIDAAMEELTFRTRAGVKKSPMQLLRQALPIFFQTKRRINKKHEYALVLLLGDAVWVKDFTSKPSDILDFIDDIEVQGDSQEEFDLSSLFDTILEKVNLPKIEDPSVIPPPYVVRVVLLYGRSRCRPVMNSSEALNILQSSPHFFLDAFYIHQPPSEDNKCEEIYDAICELDDKGLSYVFEVARNVTKLFNGLAQLVSHPLQRPLQRDADYKLTPKPFVNA